MKTIQILGKEIGSVNMPILYKWAQTHPDTLAAQLQSIANAWHEGDIGSAMIAFESDLAHEKGSYDNDETDQELDPCKIDGDVSLHNMIEAYETTPMEYILPIPLGVDEDGIAQYDDLVSLGHILMTGTTGSGKSNFGNVIIASLISLLPPSKVNFVIFDFKRVEFSVYSKLPYLQSDVIVNTDIAFLELEKLILEKRIRLSKENIDDSPYIVVLIDTFSDWIIADKGRFEDRLDELLKGATAARIHVIMWDSRLSPKTYTPRIMGLFPTKICFNVVDIESSELFIGTAGAENFRGGGDMLLLKEDCMFPIRIQGTFISGEEITRLVERCNNKM
jgi:S-DNA-T family DNA segregation ATPase FtsK/SpoIIIE